MHLELNRSFEDPKWGRYGLLNLMLLAWGDVPLQWWANAGCGHILFETQFTNTSWRMRIAGKKKNIAVLTLDEKTFVQEQGRL